MLQLPLLGAGAPGLVKGPGPERPGGSAGPEGLLQAVDGALAGLSGELQALLLQMSPQMLQRLDELVEGGMSLPLAAKSLLAETGFGGAGESFAQFLRDGLAAPGQPLAAQPAAVGSGAAGVPGGLGGHLMTSSGNPIDLAQTLSTVAVMQPAPQATSNSPFPPQLASSLLDMGVPQQVGGKGWGGAIADRLMWMVQGEQQFAKLRLNPPNLGPLEVRVSLHQDQASVSFLAQHAAVREALEAALPRLREMFDQQSLQLVRADIGDPGAQQGGRTHDRSGEGASQSGVGGGVSGEDESATDSHPIPGGAANSLIDLFA